MLDLTPEDLMGLGFSDLSVAAMHTTQPFSSDPPDLQSPITFYGIYHTAYGLYIVYTWCDD